jgi:Tol biopolymer transport system component
MRISIEGAKLIQWGCDDISQFIHQWRAAMRRWLADGVTLAVVISLCGCASTPQKAPETVGFSRASQVGGTDTLWIMKDDGSGQSQLHLGADGNRAMTWAPDGQYVAFESARDGNSEIYTARIIDNGDKTYSAQDIQRRTTTSANNSSPAWSHDCAWLAFSSNRANQSSHNIYQLDVNTNSVTPITSGNYEDLSPSWSPDGTKIAFTRDMANASREIYIHVMSSAQDIRLTNNNVNDTDPSWSPAGRIIFTRHSEDGSRAALFEMDAVDTNGDGNGDHLQPISTPNANEYDQKPEYARGGNAIVFFRSQEAGGGGPGDVWKLVIQDGTVMEPILNLTKTNPQHEHGATWKRNGVCVRKGR